MKRILVVAAVLCAVVIAGGCAATVTPPPMNDSAAVYLTNYGRHSSVLLPAAQGQLQEYAFGDWDWFALSRVSKRSGLRALFSSRGATLGRRQLMVEDDIDAIVRATRALTVHRFHVPRDKAEQLMKQLDRQFNDQLDTITYNALSEMWFARNGTRYSLFHNCNHVTARWLEKMGCRVRGSAMLSDFKVRASR